MALAETSHNQGFLISEAPGDYSREQIKILAGSGASRALTNGMVLGKRVTGTASAAAVTGNTGDGAMGAITVSGAAKRGRYKLVIIEPGANVGQFALFDPDGVFVSKGTVASAFSAGGLAFTLADGAADFVAGDAFTIDVQVSAEKWLQLDVAATTGEAVAAGILGDDITALDAVDNPYGMAFVRSCIVNAAEIVWPAGISAANKANALLELGRLGIIAR
jgi:hypothetical protein